MASAELRLDDRPTSRAAPVFAGPGIGLEVPTLAALFTLFKKRPLHGSAIRHPLPVLAERRQEFFDKDRQSEPVTHAREEG